MTIHKAALLAAIVLLICVSAAFTQSREKPVRVMSFNIRYDEPRDGVNAWANRKSKVADVIRFHKADIVGVQEALITQLRELETLLPDFAWLGVGRTDGKEGGEYSAILYSEGRFQPLNSGTFWLSATPETVGSIGWDAALPRIVTWARFKDKSTGRSFYHFNTHFDHRGEKARIESARLIVEKIAEIAKRETFVLTGDFNVREETEAYKAIKEGSAAVQMKDARYASVSGHFGGDSTFSAFKDLVPGMKIDHIFVRDGVTVLEHGVLSDQWNDLWASDHLPVIAEVVFPR